MAVQLWLNGNFPHISKGRKKFLTDSSYPVQEGKKKGEQKQREKEFQREEENKERGASRGKVYALSSCAKMTWCVLFSNVFVRICPALSGYLFLSFMIQTRYALFVAQVSLLLKSV